jgi:predicted Zn-dependent protease
LHAHANQLSTISFSRANELEADHVGFFACVAAPSHACRSGSLQSFFRKLDGGGEFARLALTVVLPTDRDRPSTP